MKEKLVVITGASSGIGKALYEGYKDMPGYLVTGISRRGPDIVADLSRHRSVIKDVIDRIGLVHLLINCAGVMPLVEDNELDNIMQVNFWAPYHLSRLLICRNLIIVNIASVAAMVPDEYQPIYAASKAAMIAMTKSFAKRYVDMGVRVNCISPGFYDTNLVPEETPKGLIDTIPMKREEDPKELFPVVRMIEQTGYMTGSNIVVDGGLLC